MDNSVSEDLFADSILKHPDIYLEHILDLLKGYCDSVHGEDVKYFESKIKSRYFNVDSESGSSVFREVMDIYKNDKKLSEQLGPLGLIAISTAYCGDAARGLESTDADRDLIWLSLAKAAYWCGTALATKGIPEAYKETVLATRKSTGKKGGSARAKKYDPAKQEAYRLLVEMCPRNKWQSKMQAANEIAPRLNEFLKKKKINLSENRLTTTLSEWISDMENRGEYFRGGSG